MPGFRRRFCACVAPVNEPAHQRGAPHRAGARPPAPGRTGPGSPLTPARAQSRAIAAAAARTCRCQRPGTCAAGPRLTARTSGQGGAKGPFPAETPAPRLALAGRRRRSEARAPGPARPARPGAGLRSRGSADATRGARAAPKAAARKFALKPHRGGRKLILGPDSLTEMLKRKGGGAWRPQGRGRAAGRCGPPAGDLTALGRRRLGPAAACLVRLTPRFISGR